MEVPTTRGAPGARLTECNEFLAARKGRDQPQTGVDAGRHHDEPRRQQLSLGMGQEVLVQQHLPYIHLAITQSFTTQPLHTVVPRQKERRGGRTLQGFQTAGRQPHTAPKAS